MYYRVRSTCSSFINRDGWGEALLKAYFDIALDEVDGVYRYLDKRSFEYIELSDEDLEKIKKTFLERIEKKKLKYADEIDEIRSKKIFRGWKPRYV